jgi:hypothetical protein
MGFAGELRTVDLSDLLTWIDKRKQTGTLRLQRRSTQKRLVFQNGRLHSSWSNDPRESLGQVLIKDELLSEQALFEALVQQEKEGGRLGAILVKRGIIGEDQLMRALRGKAEELVYDLFLWSDGRFEFEDQDSVTEDPVVNLNMDTAMVIEEGAHRREEWQKLREWFPTPDVTFQVQRAAYGIDENPERQTLGLAAAGMTLSAISLEMRRSEFETALVLRGLCERGALAVGDVRQDAVETDPVAAIEALLRSAEQRLRESRFPAALEAYEQVLALDRLSQAAKKGLIAVAEAREQARIRRRIPLKRVPFVSMPSLPLSRETFDPQEGFVLSRINGQWDVGSILKLCPMSEEDALLIFARLLDRKVISLS